MEAERTFVIICKIQLRETVSIFTLPIILFKHCSFSMYTASNQRNDEHLDRCLPPIYLMFLKRNTFGLVHTTLVKTFESCLMRIKL